MNLRTDQIGFSQRVRLEWLEQTAGLVLDGNDRSTIFAALEDLLKDKVSIGGTAVRGNREKIITILMKVWFNAPRELESLRIDGLQLIRRLPCNHHLAVHWGMIMAVYPFWGAVAACTGRFLKLQGTAAAAHVQRRLREHYGERETVSRAARRVLRSYVDWGVLKESGTKGVYSQGMSLMIENPGLFAWLIEAFLHTLPGGRAPLKTVLESPGLFPFRFQPAAADGALAASSRLEVLRLGLDEELVMLRD
ncbi:hypothetical protein GFC01_08430 [Desulfofundulus thermobenzoicus]|uniref:DUF1819 family protein n=1 Tax=Desulfofundulus thermobenzoicus TaxID=29376 RepID=A0A6N7IQE4_9FIRM|nr:hypothetical protein [Desulfofundulus thermobenzoicus]MQL52295.1 hypothetical protein [Desulfofundulus thermobenzoicus]